MDLVKAILYLTSVLSEQGGIIQVQPSSFHSLGRRICHYTWNLKKKGGDKKAALN